MTLPIEPGPGPVTNACKFQVCTNPCKRLIKGYCDTHYKRLQRHGDPAVTKPGFRFSKGYDSRRHKAAVGGRSFGRMVHGTSGTPAYISWKSMNTRCRNPKACNYKRYGGKGISICERWRSFALFYEDMGERPEGTSLDRIDETGNYEPSNCRWADYKLQARNSGRKRGEN